MFWSTLQVIYVQPGSIPFTPILPLPAVRLRFKYNTEFEVVLVLILIESSGAGFEPVFTGISVPENLENTCCPEILEPGDKKDLSSYAGPSTTSTVNYFNFLLGYI